MTTRGDLELGPELIRLLLPHRRPFLMVDRVTAFTRTPRPRLLAQRYISTNEPVFAGHFPDLALWPGVYTLEGLGQSCNLATVLVVLLEQAEAQGARAEEVLDLLGRVELGFRLQPGVGPDCLPRLRAHLPPVATFMGFMAAAEVKFLAPVLAGHRLDYAVERTHVVGEMVRYAVEATVDGRPVARGTLTSTVGLPVPVPLP